MRFLRPVVLASMLSAAASASQAAQIRAVQLPGGGDAIQLSGVIVPGDEAAFHTLAATLRTAVVVTTGPGGTVGPALAIGTETRARGWTTLVPQDGRCASACSMIWLAGRTRKLAAGAAIGFHAMSMIENGTRTETHEADIYLRHWLTGLGYAMDTTATIVNIGASSIRWYNAVELRANGIPSETYP